MTPETLIEQLKTKDIDPEVLDGLVHEVMSSRATQINNQGLEAQVEFLFGELGTDAEQAILGLMSEDVRTPVPAEVHSDDRVF